MNTFLKSKTKFYKQKNNQTNNPEKVQKMSLKQQQKSIIYFTLQELFQAYNQIELSTYRKSTSLSPTASHNDQNKIFLIFGITTSGKTVVSYFLCQDELEFGVEQKKKLPYLLPVKQYKGAAVEKAPITITSRCPNVRAHLQPLSQKSDQRQIVFIQVPDIKQLKAEQKTVEYLFLQRVFKTFHNIHLLIVIPQFSLDDAASLIENFQCITSLFDLEDSSIHQTLSSTLSIIINKADPSNQLSDIRQKLQDLNNDIIQQQNQHLYSIIDTIIRDDRVYMIKQGQPQQSEQTYLLEEIVKNSECNQFDDVRLNFIELQEILDSDQAVNNIIEKEQLVDQWLENCLHFKVLVEYLADQQNRQENFASIQPLLNQYHHNQQNSNSQMPPLEGKLPSSIKSSLKQFIRSLISQQELQTVNLLSIHTLENLINLVKISAFEQLGIIRSRESSESTSQSNPVQECPQSNKVFYRILIKILNNLLLSIDYLTEVMDYEGIKQQTDNENLQRKFNKQCLQELVQEMIAKLKEQFKEFNLALLSSKGKKTSTKKSKKQIIITKSYSIDDLKNQILKDFKSKPYHQLLYHLLKLPHTHFKLYMLCLQIPSDLEPFINKSFAQFLTIVKEISEILKVAKLYVEQIIFLLLIPDWNKIQTVVKEIERGGKKMIAEEGKKEKIQLLNSVGVYANLKRRNKLGQRIFKLVDSIVEEMGAKNPSITLNEIQSQRQKLINEKIDEKFFLIQALKLYSQPMSGHPFIVEAVKARQQADPTSFEKANQFFHLISQEKF